MNQLAKLASSHLNRSAASDEANDRSIVDSSDIQTPVLQIEQIPFYAKGNCV